jgi:hypothetical protein
MSYGLHHPQGLPGRSRNVEGEGFRTPSTIARWACADILSHLISIVGAIALASLMAVVLLAMFGWKDRGSQFTLLNGMISIVFLGVLKGGYQSMRQRTRPSPPSPPVEFHSGRSSPLWDRELDG